MVRRLQQDAGKPAELIRGWIEVPAFAKPASAVQGRSGKVVLNSIRR
jgi:hypothetical protein